MGRPGVDVTLLDTPGSVSLPTDTGTAFAVGLCDRGPADETLLIQSLNDFVTKYGDRQAYSVLYDWVDEFFREGGNRVYIGRVVGPGATVGFLNLLDGAAAISLVAHAKGPGAYSADYKVQVLAGNAPGSYQLQVLDADNNVLENSGDLLDQPSAELWSTYSSYIDITIGAAADNPAVAAAAALSAGNDDRANITDAQWAAALALFTSDLGPGQVTEPGRTSATAYGQLIAHVEANNRVAILDGADTPTEATLLAAAGAQQSRFAAYFAPWVRIPGVVSGTTRSVPPSALVCGKIAANDPALGVNRPSAGNAGISNYATGLSQPAWDDATREALNAGGVNVIRMYPSGVRIYGWRSLADPVADVNWLPFSNARLFMQIQAELNSGAENYVFAEVDGLNGETLSGFHDMIAGVGMAHFQARELFGDTADQAFNVDTSAAVNTPQTLQNLELHGVLQVRMAPFAEWVDIQVVKRALTDNLVPATSAAA